MPFALSQGLGGDTAAMDVEARKDVIPRDARRPRGEQEDFSTEE